MGGGGKKARNRPLQGKVVTGDKEREGTGPTSHPFDSRGVLNMGTPGLQRLDQGRVAALVGGLGIAANPGS